MIRTESKNTKKKEKKYHFKWLHQQWWFFIYTHRVSRADVAFLSFTDFVHGLTLQRVDISSYLDPEHMN